MKKYLAIAVALVMVASLSVSAFADWTPDSNNEASSTEQQMPGNFQPGQGPNGGFGMNGQPPMMGGQAPDMNGQAPMMNSEIPSDLPEFNGQAPEMNGQQPMMGGRGPGMMGQQSNGAPGFIDFDSMVTDGVISQETCDKIKAYMEENKPADLPEMNGEAPSGETPADMPTRPEMNGEAPDMNGQPPEMNGEAPEFDGESPMVNGLLNDLLEASIITQAEYDALVAAIAE